MPRPARPAPAPGPAPHRPSPSRLPRRSAARAKLDAAEAQGRAFDRQMELLTAVRAYFAERQAAAQ
jgi:hypothetical protein